MSFVMCLYPKLIKNPKYKGNKKNGGNVPELKDARVLYVPIGCGNCMECRKKKASEWRVRLCEEVRVNDTGIFVTLTFSNATIRRFYHKLKKMHKKAGLMMPEGYDLDNAIAKYGVQTFINRYRMKFGEYPRYWLITELGHAGTENIHLHGVIFDSDREKIKDRWGDDFVFFGYSMNDTCINYMIKYVTKMDADHKYYKPKIFCSRGIGKNYLERYDSKLNTFKGGSTDESYKFKNGSKCSLPIYYRNKIYTDEEREDLWIYKLDEAKRYVLGEKIDISKGLKNYFNVLRDAQEKNQRLGYGDDVIDFDTYEYERQLRNINFKKRLNN